MSIITTGNMNSLLKEGLYVPKQKKKMPLKVKTTKNTNSKKGK